MVLNQRASRVIIQSNAARQPVMAKQTRKPAASLTVRCRLCHVAGEILAQ